MIKVAKENKLNRSDCTIVPLKKPKDSKQPIQVRALEAAKEHFDTSTPEGRYILARLETKAKHASKRALKPKKTEWQKTRDKADTTFQKYIRMRDADENYRRFRCCTCGKIKPTQNLQAGHCIERLSRGSMGTRWEETNAHGQCDYCNKPDGGHGEREKHEIYIIAKYGQKELDRLLVLQKINAKKPTIEFMNGIIEKYQKKTKDLEEE